MGGFRSTWYRLAVLLMTLLVPFSWFTTGPGNLAFAIQVIGWTFVLDPVLIDLVERFMPDSWFHVPQGERVIHRLLGVSIFSRLLELSGWNNVIVRPILKTEGYRSGTKASLAVRANSARRGGGAHAICFALHVLAGRGHGLRRVPVERAVGAAAGRGCPPLPDPTAALHPAPPPASARPRSGRALV